MFLIFIAVLVSAVAFFVVLHLYASWTIRNIDQANETSSSG